MATDPTDSSSVRVEIDEPANGMAGDRAWIGWLALAFGVLAVALFAVWSDREPNSTGTGTIIVERGGVTAPRSDATSVSPTSVPPASASSLPEEPADSFERRSFDEFITGAVAYKGGWLAFGFGGLVWSGNGLDWGPFSTGLSVRELVAWSVVDGDLLLAATRNTAISGGDPALEEVEFAVWRLGGNGDLRPVPEYGTYRDAALRVSSVGSVAGGVFGIWLMPQVEDRTRRAQIADFLSPWLSSDELMQTCRVVRAAVETANESDGFVNAVEFRSCDEESIARVLTEDLGGGSTNRLVRCLSSYVNPIVTHARFIRLESNVPPLIEQFEPSEPITFVLPAPDGSLVMSRRPLSQPSEGCDADAQAAKLVLTLELRPTSGPAVEIDLSFLEGKTFRPWLFPLSDGSALVRTDFAVYRLAPGGQDFEKIVTTPFAGSLIEYVVDGRFFAQSGNTGAISGIDGVWTTFDLGSPKRASLVIAGDGFVVVEVGGSELVKIPLDPG